MAVCDGRNTEKLATFLNKEQARHSTQMDFTVYTGICINIYESNKAKVISDK